MTVQEAIIEYLAEKYTGDYRLRSYGPIFIDPEDNCSHDVGDTRFHVGHIRTTTTYHDPEKVISERLHA